MRSFGPVLAALLTVTALTASGVAHAQRNSPGKTKKSATAAKTNKSPWKVVADGVKRMETTVSNPSRSARKLWIYLPTSYKPGTKLPCVLIAPAGSRGFHGMRLVKEDAYEHIPFVWAGFAVVAYEVDGPVDDADENDDAKVLQAVHRFASANGGIYNAQAALDAVFANATFLDKSKVYAVGHSSAATLALQVAAHDPRIAACVAFAPEVDMVEHLDKALDIFDQGEPGFRQMISDLNPSTHPDAVKCPLFLFVAKDDKVISPEAIEAYANQAQRTNKNVTLVSVPTGGHNDAMVEKGLIASVRWLRQLR